MQMQMKQQTMKSRTITPIITSGSQVNPAVAVDVVDPELVALMAAIISSKLVPAVAVVKFQLQPFVAQHVVAPNPSMRNPLDGSMMISLLLFTHVATPSCFIFEKKKV